VDARVLERGGKGQNISRCFVYWWSVDPLQRNRATWHPRWPLGLSIGQSTQPQKSVKIWVSVPGSFAKGASKTSLLCYTVDFYALQSRSIQYCNKILKMRKYYPLISCTKIQLSFKGICNTSITHNTSLTRYNVWYLYKYLHWHKTSKYVDITIDQVKFGVHSHDTRFKRLWRFSEICPWPQTHSWQYQNIQMQQNKIKKWNDRQNHIFSSFSDWFVIIKDIWILKNNWTMCNSMCFLSLIQSEFKRGPHLFKDLLKLHYQKSFEFNLWFSMATALHISPFIQIKKKISLTKS